MKNIDVNSASSVLSDVIANLENLVQAVELLEKKDDNSIFPLMKSNLKYDIEKLEQLLRDDA